MAAEYDFDLDPVSFITVGAEGPPGHRTFYLQAAAGQEVLTLTIEKEQAAALAESIERLLAALQRHDPEYARHVQPLQMDMALIEPLDAKFRVGQMGIGVDEERHVIVLIAHEGHGQPSAMRARFVATYEQMLTMARQAAAVVAQGRPLCDLCGEPIDPDGHFCVRRNGHNAWPPA